MTGNIYTKLNPSRHEIRIVRLHSPQLDSRIRCNLLTTSLDDRPEYEALSYAWGESPSRYSIDLDSVSVSVTDNLYEALRRLQPRSGVKLLWIDQICINQADTTERSLQVRLMARVYSEAKRALLWLGEETSPNSSIIPSDEIQLPRTKACDWIWRPNTRDRRGGFYQVANQTSQSFQEDGGDLILKAFELVCQLANGGELAGKHAKINDTPTTQALWLLMHRPWWSRVWTLQECLLPARSLLLYGPVSAPFEMFLHAAANLETDSTIIFDSEHEWGRRVPSDNATRLRHFRQTLKDIRNFRQQQLEGTKLDLISLLRSFRIRESSDDRDKIYGFLGLNIDWHGQEPILPDYELSTAQVYQTFTLKLIRSTKTLGVLINNLDRNRDSRRTVDLPVIPQQPKLPAAASSELQALLQQIDDWNTEFREAPTFFDAYQTVLELPSWVPDWSASTNFEILMRYHQAELYSASKATITTYRLINDSILALKGIKIDTVRWSSQIMAFKDGEDRASLFKEWRTFAKDAFAYKFVSPTELDGRSDHHLPGDPYWRTICGDTVVRLSPSSSSGPELRRADVGNHYNFVLWYDLLESETSPTPSEAGPSGAKTHKFNERDCDIIDSSIRAATTMRRMFVTKNGYLGLGPPQTVGGEQIFVLYGGAAPFVLREQKRQTIKGESSICYEIIGDCYVHGIMDGEAMGWNLPETEVLLI